MFSRRNYLWILIGGASCLVVLTSLSLLSRRDDTSRSTSPTPSPSQNVTSRTQETGFSHDLPAPPSTPPAANEEQSAIPAIPPKAPYSLPPVDDAKRRQLITGLNAKMRDAMRAQYGSLFQRLHLSSDLQEKVIDILTKQDEELAQQAFDAAQSGSFPTPPSPEAMRARQLQQDQQLRSVLGDAGFAEFNQYRTTFPDRMIIDQMNQAGANLSESQSQQLLAVLSQTRQQIMDQAATTQNLSSMSPDQARTLVQQQETLRQQAVSDRVQNLLTPEQARTLQTILGQRSLGQKSQ